MPARWLYISLLVPVGPPASYAAEITALPELAGGALERGVAGIRCAIGDDAFWTSRAAVLELGAANVDVLLTAAHGLPPDAATIKRQCRVLARGREHEIEDVRNAGGHLAGAEHDWAVIALKRRIAGDVYRWRAAHATHDWLIKAAADGAPVKLVLRHDDADATDCHLEPQTQGPGSLLAHSCIAHPGISGSPLVVGLGTGAEPMLLAIHVGTQMQWLGTKLDFVRVARPIDAEIAAAISAAAARASQPTRR